MASKKLKKLLKKAGKAALIGGALYGATKLARGRRGTHSVNPVGGLDSLIRRNRAIDVGIQSAEDDNGSEMYVPKRIKHPYDRDYSNYMDWDTKYKKGGRVTGIAKRGFGRALMKGKK